LAFDTSEGNNRSAPLLGIDLAPGEVAYNCPNIARDKLAPDLDMAAVDTVVAAASGFDTVVVDTGVEADFDKAVVDIEAVPDFDRAAADIASAVEAAFE